MVLGIHDIGLVFILGNYKAAEVVVGRIYEVPDDLLFAPFVWRGLDGSAYFGQAVEERSVGSDKLAQLINGLVHIMSSKGSKNSMDSKISQPK